MLSFLRLLFSRVFVDAFSSSSSSPSRDDPILVEDRSLILERVDIVVVDIDAFVLLLLR
jgi:hypothetical protein